MFNKILVVCLGNICRSPMGECLLKTLQPDRQIDSAGIAVEKSKLTDCTADSTAIDVSAEHGISLDLHVARQLTATLAHQYDLLLVMEKRHIEAVCNIAPEIRGKIMLFGQWIGQKDIPDPHRQSREAFEHAWTLIEEAANAWVKKL